MSRDHKDGRIWDALDHSCAAALLAGYLPGAEQHDLEPFGQGDFCLAFKMASQVVRVARHRQAAAALRRESCVMAAIANMLPLAVPRPAYHAPPDCPPFTVHENVDGEVFTRDDWVGMPVVAREKLAADLATFLRALHSLPVEAAQACRLARLDASEVARSLRKKHADEILELLERDFRRPLEAVLELWSQPAHDGSQPVLLHCDIAPGHLLFDPSSGSLSGVIDFGDIAIGDAARDFIYLYEDYGPDILEDVLNRYDAQGGQEMLPAIHQWYLLETLSWAVALDPAQHRAQLAQALAEIRREVALIAC